eukprot:Tbor_TRINITY_DN3288_c0_g1::TRINITY_DN3288_c0_g1_i1::g.23820::m.23820
MTSEIYVRTYPSIQELENSKNDQLQQLVTTLENNFCLLQEETRILENFLRLQKEKDTFSTLHVPEGFDVSASEGQTGEVIAPQTPKPSESNDYGTYLSMEDKHVVLALEHERLKKMRQRGHKNVDDTRDMIQATMEDATNRMKDVRAEMQYFGTEILDARYEQNPATVSAAGASLDKIIKYFEERPTMKLQHAKKLRDKCNVLQQQIVKNSQILKLKDDVGDFHLIDFDQLKIENQQFTERIDQKNLELVDVKGTTTRTIQSLSRYTDRLNILVRDQKQLQKELRVREEFQQRLKTEMEQVQRDAVASRHKNENLKVQHESLKVPKVDDYIAQKAKMLELHKSAQNWKRKVEILTGQVAVMKQQMLSFSKKKTMEDEGTKIGIRSKRTSNTSVGITGTAMRIR